MNGWEAGHIGEEWLTYQQAGDRLGITSEAARQRARRFGWRHQRGNDGRTLIQLPVDAGSRPGVQPPDKPAVQTPVQPTVQTPGQTVALSGWDNGGEALRELVHVLRDQLAKAEERERDARQQVREERERSAAAEARAAAAEQHAAELRRLLDDELTALHADLAWAKARPVAGPGRDRSTAIGHRLLSRWSWLRGFTRRQGR